MTDEIDWLTGAPAPSSSPAPARIRRPKTALPSDLGSIPFADAWLLFRVGDDGLAEDLRVVAGSHLNRLRGEAKDWSWDVGLHGFGDDPATAWREFLLRWRLAPEAAPAALREAAKISGLEWLYGQAGYLDDAA